MSPLPRIVRDLLREWQLVPDGEPDGPAPGASWIGAVTGADGPAVLKIGLPFAGGHAHEALALQTWHGRGAVRLLRADPRRHALLLERLRPVDLSTRPVLQACEIVAELYGRLHVPPPPQLVPLTRHVASWVDELAQLPRDAPVPRRVVEQAVHLGRSLAGDAGSDGRMIHGDLTFAHVLGGDREPWLAIAPRPLSGDPHAELAPLLSGQWDEAVSSGDVRTAVRRRFHTVVDAAGLDEDRARDWVVLQEAHRAVEAVQRDDSDRVTTAVAIVKAVQD
jgi:streptomycin 6-kinase